MPILEDYQARFRRLKRDALNPWPASTLSRAPHKAFLLLAVFDLIEEGTLTDNFVQISPDLNDVFSIYWSKLMPTDQLGNLAMPFFHLKSEGFWHLQPRPSKEEILESSGAVTSLPKLKDLVLGARLDEELFALLCDASTRQLLRTTLIEACFAPEVHALLLEQSAVNVEAFQYCATLLEQAKERRIEENIQTESAKIAVRDQGFRRAVVTAYNHRCAMCGVRILTSDGHTAVDAAHIKPWSVSKNDDPRNGFALCKLCHWTFDEGLTGVSPKFEVVISNQLATNDNLPGYLVTMAQRPIFKPEDKDLWPDVNMVKWHYEKVFRKR